MSKSYFSYRNIIILILGIVVYNIIITSIVTVRSGNVGVIYTFNKLHQTTLEPGLHFINGLTDKKEDIYIFPQKDIIYNVDCRTNEGLQSKFDYVEIGNTLPKEKVLHVISNYDLDYDKYLVIDKVRHQINVICSKLQVHEISIEFFDKIDDQLKDFIQDFNDDLKTGLVINYVRMSKTNLPDFIQQNYNKHAEEKSLKKVIEEKKERTRAEKETELFISIKDAEITMSQARATNDKMIINIKAKQEEQRIENEIIVERARANAEKIILEADALKSMYNLPNYDKIEVAKQIAQNQKIYYGANLPLFSTSN
jgi:regulator of protease activity HflC (stomatin/prohibitin superfamily)